MNTENDSEMRIKRDCYSPGSLMNTFIDNIAEQKSGRQDIVQNNQNK